MELGTITTILYISLTCCVIIAMNLVGVDFAAIEFN